MKNKYIDLIEQTFEFPQDEFSVVDNELNFHEVPLMDVIKQYGTPLKVTYLPKITTGQAIVECGDGQSGLPGELQLLLLHEKFPLLIRAGRGAEERH